MQLSAATAKKRKVGEINQQWLNVITFFKPTQFIAAPNQFSLHLTLSYGALAVPNLTQLCFAELSKTKIALQQQPALCMASVSTSVWNLIWSEWRCKGTEGFIFFFLWLPLNFIVLLIDASISVCFSRNCPFLTCFWLFAGLNITKYKYTASIFSFWLCVFVSCNTLWHYVPCPPHSRQLNTSYQRWKYLTMAKSVWWLTWMKHLSTVHLR